MELANGVKTLKNAITSKYNPNNPTHVSLRDSAVAVGRSAATAVNRGLIPEAGKIARTRYGKRVQKEWKKFTTKSELGKSVDGFVKDAGKAIGNRLVQSEGGRKVLSQVGTMASSFGKSAKIKGLKGASNIIQEGISNKKFSITDVELIDFSSPNTTNNLISKAGEVIDIGARTLHDYTSDTRRLSKDATGFGKTIGKSATNSVIDKYDLNSKKWNRRR
jgi:hypothetical protein